MTRNLYVGSSFTHALTATDPTDFVLGVSRIWANVKQTDFRTRANAIAGEIAARRPDIVGVQEASRWERLSADPLQLDYLQILLDALRARGLSYGVATVVEGFTVTAPAFEDGQQIGLRLTDRDAILVRTDSAQLAVTATGGQNFVARLVVPTALGVSIPVPRMWTQVDGTFAGVPFRFVNTHLDPDSPAIQLQQAQELLAGPYATTRPLIAVGDFNSRADGSSTGTYALLTGAGLADVWTGGNGFTCCQAELLDNPSSLLSERIDLVLTRGGVTAKETSVIGDRTKDRIAGLWPSDHAGVVAQLKLQKK
jgi:endonuclease/exonuclease/phosphatase family metal-dependent hydrolase